MAFSAFRGPTSPREEHSFPAAYPTNPLSPPRNSNRLSGGVLPSAAEQRVGLQRRFTTNALPTLSPIGQQRLQAAGDMKQQPNRYSTLPPSEQKSRFYESLLAEQRRIQAFIEQIDPETRREVDQNLRHEHAVSQMIAQSEPTTPPDYGDAFPSAFSRPNRYSTTSMTSAPTSTTRPNRSSTQLTSPRMGLSRMYGNKSNIPSQSVPGSRRHSDDEEDADEFLTDYELGMQRNVTNPNRKSLPVTRHDRKQANVPDLSSVLGPVNTTSFLFGDESRPQPPISNSIHTSPQDGKTYLQVQHTADGFPKLIRREENGELALTALDAALAKQDTQLSDRTTASRHRISLPPNGIRNNDVNIAGIGGILSASNDRTTNRHSIEARPSLKTTPPRNHSNGSMQVSYSTNDVPTLKSMNAVASPTTTHQKTPSVHRAFIGPFQSPQNQPTTIALPTDSIPTTMNTPLSSLQASAPAFGPSGTHTPTDSAVGYDLIGSPGMQQYNQQAFYGGYGMQMLSNGFGNMSFNGAQPGANNWNSPYQQNNGYNWSGQNGQATAGAPRYGTEHHRYNSRVHKAITEESALARITAVNPEDFKGEVASLCVDQHGCRFLQRKLDEHDPVTTNMIYEEVRPNIVKLMIDPFGNYLCQKLLEFCTDAQRTELIKGTTSKMAEIALNQHGTRALQKMIEQINSPEQTELIVEALRYKVVMLIQDLNGNHVIQKCLNHLKAADAQFIFDAVGANCVTVGTHRHGCCVLQRCIDHAAGLQKGELVRQITSHAMTLVLDPFGNYVIQYIIDIGEPCFIEPVCKSFLGSIVQLARQKFSSNVIEKCIRSAGKDTRDLMIKEISPPAILESMLRDNYGNYVIQTAVDYASDDVKTNLVNNLRPLVVPIRNSPPGRRLLQKIAEWDGQYINVPPSAELVNARMQPNSPQGILAAHGAYGPTNGARAHRMGFVSAPAGWSLQNQDNGNTPPTTSAANGQSFDITAGGPNAYQNGMNGQQHAMNGNGGAFPSAQLANGGRNGHANYPFF